MPRLNLNPIDPHLDKLLWGALFAITLSAFVSCAGPVAAQTPQIMPADELAELRKLLPRVPDAEIQAILDDPTTLFYDERSMPPAYLIGGGPQGNQSPLRPADPKRNASRDGRGTEQSKGDGAGGNANVDFPWKMVAGGTNLTLNTRAVKFQWLPKQKSGQPFPIVYYRTVYRHLFNPGDRTAGIAWIHPVGTVYGELLLQRLPDGSDVPFELRVRRRGETWTVQMFEPFGTPASLAAEIKRRRPRWSADPFLIAAVLDLENKHKPLAEDKLEKTFPGATYARQGRLTTGDDVLAIKLAGKVDRLLPLNDDRLVQELCCDRAWEETTDSEWRPGAAMPTVNLPGDDEITAAFSGLMSLDLVAKRDVTEEASYVHIKPARYAGPFMGKNEVDCGQCHEHTGLSARSFDQGRGWYGCVRGSDQILSWHPFEPAAYVGQVQPAVTTTGPNNWIPPLRKEFVTAGLVERYEPARHVAKWYFTVR